MTPKPHPGLAAVFSFVFNGLGQIYNGQIAKGLWIIFLSSLSMLVMIMGAVLIGYWTLGKIISTPALTIGIFLFMASLLAICIIGIYSIFDAYRFAQQLNRDVP
jgi:TM2 domain-containing membrane protein YozV